MARRLSIDKGALFHLLGYQPHEGQQRVHDSTAPRRVLACGARWGKSMCGVYEAIAAALEPREHSIGWIVGPTADLADRIFGKVLSIAREHLGHRIVVSKERDKYFTIRNLAGGLSEVRAKSADSMVSLLGEALDWLIVDEAARLPGQVWSGHLAQRLVDRQGWALLLSTPRGLNWLHEAFRLGQKGRDPQYESWRAPSWQNPHLSPLAIKAERKRLPEDSFAQEFEAVFVGVGDDPCETCGGPSEEAKLLIEVESEDWFRACADCNGAVDGDGRTLLWKCPDGKGRVLVIDNRTAAGWQMGRGDVWSAGVGVYTPEVACHGA